MEKRKLKKKVRYNAINSTGDPLKPVHEPMFPLLLCWKITGNILMQKRLELRTIALAFQGFGEHL